MTGIDTFLLYLLVGAIGGFLMGIIGSGIGPIVIPLLIYILNSIKIPNFLISKIAISTSLAIISVTSLLGIFFHNRNESINWNIYKKLLPGSLMGALLGSYCIIIFSNSTLKYLFGFILLIVGISMFLREPQNNFKKNDLSNFNLYTSSFIIAYISNLAGVSDGIFLVPYLKKNNIPLTQAVATACAIVFPVSILGTFSILLSSYKVPFITTGCFGFIYLPAFIGITITSSCISIYGITLSKKLPEQLIKYIFGIFVIIVSFKMVF